MVDRESWTVKCYPEGSQKTRVEIPFGSLSRSVWQEPVHERAFGISYRAPIGRHKEKWYDFAFDNASALQGFLDAIPKSWKK